MNCADFLPYLETGSAAQRIRARLHAVRCRQCAAVLDAWALAKRQLSSTESLTLSQRRAWERAAREMVVQPQFRWRLIPTALVTTLAACVVFAVVWTVPHAFRRPPAGDGPGHVQVADVSSVREISVSDEFVTLETRVELLRLELAALEPQAELLDARHQVNDLLNQYSKW
jgi:hypothetical protein